MNKIYMSKTKIKHMNAFYFNSLTLGDNPSKRRKIEFKTMKKTIGKITPLSFPRKYG